jgi:hypothetical protein
MMMMECTRRCPRWSSLGSLGDSLGVELGQHLETNWVRLGAVLGTSLGKHSVQS